MQKLKSLFPISEWGKELNGLIKSIVVYIITMIVFGIVIGLLSKIPILGVIFSIVGAVISIYCVAGIVIALLIFFEFI